MTRTAYRMPAALEGDVSAGAESTEKPGHFPELAVGRELGLDEGQLRFLPVRPARSCAFERLRLRSLDSPGFLFFHVVLRCRHRGAATPQASLQLLLPASLPRVN